MIRHSISAALLLAACTANPAGNRDLEAGTAMAGATAGQTDPYLWLEEIESELDRGTEEVRIQLRPEDSGRFDVAPAEDHPFRQPGEPAPDLNARPSDAQVHQVAMSMEAKSA